MQLAPTSLIASTEATMHSPGHGHAQHSMTQQTNLCKCTHTRTHAHTHTCKHALHMHALAHK